MTKVIHKPGDQQRLEIVAALSYLLNCCDSEENPSCGADFLKYAQEKFGVEIDRKRVPNLFQFLYFLTEAYELPFKVHAVLLPVNTKYWASRQGLSNDDLIRIITAIKNDSTIGKSRTQELINKILDLSTNKTQRNFVSSKVNSIITSTIKNYSKKINLITEILNECYLNNKILNFKIHNIKKILCSSNVKIDGENLHGNVLSIIYDYDELKACIYTTINKVRVCMVVPSSCIEITNIPQENLSTRHNEFLIDNTSYTTAFDWLKNVEDHNPKSEYEITFHIASETPEYDIVQVAKAFRYVFNKDSFDYVKVMNKEKEEYEVKVSASYSKFKEFMLTNNVFMFINIIEPKELNEMIMCPIVELMLSKISSNGEVYDFELTKKLKDSFIKKHSELSKDGKNSKIYQNQKIIFKS